MGKHWLLLCIRLPLFALATFESGEFSEMDSVLSWVGAATKAAGTVGEQFQRKVPYIVVAGDQGVGKSTTINRLAKADLFPMRSKEQAEKDEPQTKIATLYRITRTTEGNANTAVVGTICTNSACKKSGCEQHTVSKDDLAKTIDRLQINCFAGFFGTEDMITVDYALPTGIDIAIVDLPGIQHSGPDKTKSKALTERWLNKYSNAIVLAVLAAEKLFQAEIFGILEDKVHKFKNRVIFVVTKVAGISRQNLGAKNMIKSDNMKLFNAQGVLLKSADQTSGEEEGMSLDDQIAMEKEWFGNHPAYSDEPDIWGIETLQKLTRRAYLRSACSNIPLLQLEMQKVLTQKETEHAELPKAAGNSEALLQIVTNKWQRMFEQDLRHKDGRKTLKDIYAKYLKKKESYSPKKELYHVGSHEGLTCQDEFFVGSPKQTGWVANGVQLMTEARLAMQAVAKRTAKWAIGNTTKLVPKLDAADRVIKRISTCDIEDAQKMMKRLLCSYTYDFSANTDSTIDYVKMISQQDQLPSALIRLVVQLCVWEPLQGLPAAVVNDRELTNALEKTLDLDRIRKKKEELEEEIRAYKSLVSTNLVCDNSEVVPATLEDEDMASLSPTTLGRNCKIVGSIMSQGECRCMVGLEGKLVRKDEDTWEGVCSVPAENFFTETEEKHWKFGKKKLKCCVVPGSPERTNIQDMNKPWPQERTWLRTAGSCGAMFGDDYNNGPKNFGKCLVPVQYLMKATEQNFEDLMYSLHLTIESPR